MPTMIKTISKPRFDVLTLSKHPMATIMAEEVEWYADVNENVLGSVIRDRTDNDWNYVILGRDERGLFRWINGNVSFAEIGEARKELLQKIEQYAHDGKSVYPQHDSIKKKNEIFKPIVPEGKLHPHFKTLMSHEGHSPAKEIIQEIAYAFVDLDGNFIEQFQTHGFNSRLWELYLYAYFHEELFLISDEYSVPDYTCIKGPQTLFIEAVTVNPNPDFDIESAPKTPQEAETLLKDYMPIKFGSALYSKLNKKYWKLSHVKNHPLVFAIHDFHKDHSMLWSRSGITTYLYGIWFKHIFDHKGNLIIVPEKIESHEYKGKKIPSGFFLQEYAEYVSAVMFSNSATISKFNRMGKLAGFGSPRVKMKRIGTCHNHDPNATKPHVFERNIDPASYTESWGQGLEMYHNPNAKHPIDPDLFPGIAHHFLVGGKMHSLLPEFFPYSSMTLVSIQKS